VRYADDFVILCASAAEAQAPWTSQGVVEANGLSLHPTRPTSGLPGSGSGFEFLGYRFEADGGGAQEEPAAVKDKVRALTPRTEGQLVRIIAELNPVLRGGSGTSSMPATEFPGWTACATAAAAVLRKQAKRPASAAVRPIIAAGPMPTSRRRAFTVTTAWQHASQSR